jgi:hypothetical protein
MNNLKGLRFGRLLVLRRNGTAKGGTVLWECMCDCGKITTKRASTLRNGMTKSCGCLKDELVGARFRLPTGEAALNNKYNHYIKNAAKRNLSFDLSLEQFKALITSDCHFCTAPPAMMFKPKSIVSSFPMNGIDRKNNSMGYFLENCVSCCKICNFMKGRLDYYDFIARCGVIYLIRKENAKNS